MIDRPGRRLEIKRFPRYCGFRKRDDFDTRVSVGRKSRYAPVIAIRDLVSCLPPVTHVYFRPRRLHLVSVLKVRDGRPFRVVIL